MKYFRKFCIVFGGNGAIDYNLLSSAANSYRIYKLDFPNLFLPLSMVPWQDSKKNTFFVNGSILTKPPKNH